MPKKFCPIKKGIYDLKVGTKNFHKKIHKEQCYRTIRKQINVIR